VLERETARARVSEIKCIERETRCEQVCVCVHACTCMCVYVSVSLCLCVCVYVSQRMRERTKEGERLCV